MVDVLPYSAKASKYYGTVRAALDKVGQPICVHDLHIAARARSEGLSLVTNKLGEFEGVPDMLTENGVQSQA